MMKHSLPGFALTLALAAGAQAANHREAPITALDHKADITDVYAFRSYDGGVEPRVTLIMGVDPLLEPGNGPNWFPFDPEIRYELRVDNDHDARPDLGFRFEFTTEQRLPDLFQVYAGVEGGATAPADAPPFLDGTPSAGVPIVPDRIDSFDSAGLGQLQRYSVTLVKYRANGTVKSARVLATDLPVVPANTGPRSMDYSALFAAGVQSLEGGVKTFAGTTDDAFWIDLGGAFDTFNTHAFPVLTAAQDAAAENIAADTVSGYAVNHLAIEVPVAWLTSTGAVEASISPAATVGVWGVTERPRITVRRFPSLLPDVDKASALFRQVQRMGNPLINELLIGTGSKDRFSMDEPANDSQFAGFLLDPSLPRVINALTAGVVAIPPPPRTDLLPVVTYAPPIAAPGTPAGPVADLLRLNTGVPPTDPMVASRLGLLGGDAAGFPNGRRVFDDVTDIALRLVVGGVLAPPFDGFDPAIGGRLGDGVNVNDAPYHDHFPYVGEAPSGRDRRHIDPGEPGCTAGAGAACPE